MLQIWKPVRFYDSTCTIVYDYSDYYEVSNTSDIRNKKTKKNISQYIRDTGYKTVVLCKNNTTKTCSAHRIVACVFHDNLEKKPFVNHKDRNGCNNHIDNLEWCTRLENSQHYRKTGSIEYKRPVIVYHYSTEYPSVLETAIALRTTTANIIEACRNRTELKGCIFEYKTTRGDYEPKSTDHITADISDVYQIYSDGRVYNKKLKRFLSLIKQNGYLSVSIHSGSGIKPKRKLVHRLVAEAFIPNPENKPFVNHIDENRANNDYKNLEWCTQAENVAHSANKNVYQYDKTGNLLKIFDSVQDASNSVGLAECSISAILHKIRTSGGYLWRLEETKFTNEELEYATNPPNPMSLQVIQYDKDGNELKLWDTAAQAAKSLNIDSSHLSAVCRGKHKTCHGFVWKYKMLQDQNLEPRIVRIRFTQEQAQDIRKLHSEGKLIKDLAIQYEKSIDSIRRVVQGKTFKQN